MGLIPTMPFVDEGQTMLPLVSVPIAIGLRLAATAAPDPALEPQVLRSSLYGFFVNPPNPLQPLVLLRPLKFAHSERFALAIIMAPAEFNNSTIRIDMSAYSEGVYFVKVKSLGENKMIVRKVLK